MINKRLLIPLFCVITYISAAQNYNYTLSDDSLVNKYASYKRVYYATRTDLKPKIDGKLNDECWKKVGTWDGDFVQQAPHQGRKPSQETEIKILYDDNYLYFGIICHDNEPEKIHPILGRRDVVNGDITGIALDTYFDKRTAFEFNVTAAGQKVDLAHLGEYQWDFNWNAVWDGKSSVGDSAWYAEMRVPFTQLRFANKKEHVWGMHIWRWIDRLSEEDQWKLIPIDAPAMVYIFGELRGIKDIPYKRNFEVMPYAKAKYIADENKNQRYGIGLDGKIGITSDFTLDYTLNPDFGQVEADPSILNLTSYEVFYDEKRPFFLEGNSILNYGAGSDLMFYSRRIGHAPSYKPDIQDNQSLSMPENTSIISALKLTGKNKKGLSLGIINSMTARENATLQTGNSKIKEAVEPFTNYFIGRVKQDLNNGNTVIGGMLTSTVRNIKDQQLDFLPDNSLVGGVDFENNWLNRKYFVAFKSFFSKVNGSTTAISDLQSNSIHNFQRPDASYLKVDPDLTSLQGWGGEFSGGKRSGKFRLIGTLDWRSPGVELNDVGYLRQADYVDQTASMIYRINKPKGILLSYYVDMDQVHHWSYGGENLGDAVNSHARFQFKNLWKVDVALNRIFSEIDTRGLRGGPALRIDGSTMSEIFVQTNSSKDLFIGTGYKMYRFDDKITWSDQYRFYVLWLISNRLNVSGEMVYKTEIDNSQYVMQPVVNNEKKYIVGKIDHKTISTTIRAEYFITPELSLQYYGNPYASVGKYLDYREVNNSKSINLKDRYSLLKIINNTDGQKILLDKQGNIVHNFNDWNPDFNFQEFRSNFVARWEYKTGSTFYFVWTNSRSRYEEKYNPSVFDSLKGIAKVKAQNVFMIKLSYWFSL
ncbi:MAG TPA: DUF5916 domain-containing protein [Draconibacterium sp.]|nr:DUF5916 domain-containing protein [Draconibacterium sp.]